MDFKTAFNIVYGRDPLPSDASKSMYDQGASVIAAAQAIQETTEPSTVDKTSSEEAINQLYLDEFGRPADQDELNYHINRFGAELDAQESADLTGELIRSVGDTTTAEADTTTADTTTTPAGGLDAGGVRRLYENVLFREADPTGLASRIGGDAKQQAEELRNSPEGLGPAKIRQIYQEVVGYSPPQDVVDYYSNVDGSGEYGGVVSRTEARDLVSKLRPDQMTRFNTNLGVPTLDFTDFNKAPVTEGAEATAGINRLLPAEANRANTFYNLAQDPRFTAPTDVLQRVAYDPEAEGVGPTMADVFGYEAYNPTTSPEELAAQDRRATDIAAFTGDERMGAGQVLSNVLGIDPVTGAELEAQVDDGTYTGLDVGGGMYGGGLATLYNKGGEVNNVGLEGLGQKMAAYGRYGDTMLAHISPEEAQMLKAMGGSGTRNPVTGLPEFFIEKLYKSVKSILKPVYKFVKPFIPYILPPPIGIPYAAAEAGFTDGKFNVKKAAIAAAKVYAQNKVSDAISGGDSFSSFAVDPVAPPKIGVPEYEIANTAMGTRDPTILESLKQGFSPSSMGESIKESFFLGEPGTSPVAKGGDFIEGAKKFASEVAKGDFKKVPGVVAGTSGVLTLEGVEKGMEETEANIREAKAALDTQRKKKEKYQRIAASLGQNNPFGYAQGGVASLSGKYLDGAGDGMSDSIPANIEGQQEARLADGEFVVPADVVADMGNGSSNAGAERLYAMMDRIRQARHGTTKQPPQVNVNNVMPA